MCMCVHISTHVYLYVVARTRIYIILALFAERAKMWQQKCHSSNKHSHDLDLWSLIIIPP